MESNRTGDHLMEQLVGATVLLDNHDCCAINILSPEYREIELQKRTSYSRAGQKVQEDHLQSLTSQLAKWQQRKEQAEARLRLIAMQRHAMLGVVGHSISKQESKKERDRMIAVLRSRQEDLRQQEQLIRKNYLQPSDCHIKRGPGRPPLEATRQPAYVDFKPNPTVELVDDSDSDDEEFEEELMKFGDRLHIQPPSSLRLEGS